MSTQVDANELLNLLESNELKTVQEITGLIQENLQLTKEAWLLNGLVDSFMVSHSSRCLDILVTVREPHDKHLFDKLAEHLRSSHHRSDALLILTHVVNHQPPWLHKVTQHPLLGILLKCLKTDSDVQVLMCGVFIITALLPEIPVLIANYLQEIFDVFTRLTMFVAKKPANIPDVHLLHLQVGIYSLFHRLYGMYPCNFLTYLRSVFSKVDNQPVFSEYIKPMLERVRMHPMLVTATKDKEVSTDRWRKKEPHDIMVECARLSLDLIEGTSEEPLTCPIKALHSQQQLRQQATIPPQLLSTLSDSHCVAPLRVEPVHHPHIEPLLTEQEASGQFWSPSTICGLATPPPTTSSTTEAFPFPPTPGGTSVTPQRTPHLDSPQPLGYTPVDKTPLTPHTPITPSSSQSHPTPQKRLSVISMSLAGRDDGLGFNSVPQSPLKLETIEPPVFNLARSAAIRKISFDTSEALGTANDVSSPEEAMEATEETSGGKVEKQAEEAGMDLTTPLPSGTAEIIFPTVSQLPNFIDSLDENKLEDEKLSDIDQEVSALTGDRSRSTTTSESSDGMPSHIPSECKTAESVAAFMKQVNRIRFNTINTVYPQLPHKGISRSNSCPNIEKEEQILPSPCEEEEDDSRQRHPSHSTSYTLHPQSKLPITTAVSTGALATTVTNVTTVTSTTTTVTSQTKVMVPSSPEGSIQEVIVPQPEFPHQELLSKVLPYAPMLQCGSCAQRHKEEMRSGKAGQSLSPTPNVNIAEGFASPLCCSISPADLLDRHIVLGGEVHAQELNQISLTSHGNVSWTHFGDVTGKGVPPTDEVNILRGQILLLQYQLMFERHKRELHAKRNRRLLGRIVKTTALEEQNSAMKDQLRLQENEIHRLMESLRQEQRTNTQLKQAKDACDFEKSVQQRTSLQEIENLQQQNRELKVQLSVKKCENARLHKDLETVQCQMFIQEQELQSMKRHSSQAQELRDQVTRLNKELLLMGELQQKYQQRLAAVTNRHNPKPEMKFILESYKEELAASKMSSEHTRLHLDASKARLAELEEQLKQKDVVLAETKKLLEEVKHQHTGQLQAICEKYNTQKKIQLALQAQILQLHSQMSHQEKQQIPESQSEMIPAGPNIHTHKDDETSVEAGALYVADLASSPTHHAGDYMPMAPHVLAETPDTRPSLRVEVPSVKSEVSAEQGSTTSPALSPQGLSSAETSAFQAYRKELTENIEIPSVPDVSKTKEAKT